DSVLPCSYVAHRALHSFPTRRSSDLARNVYRLDVCSWDLAVGFINGVVFSRDVYCARLFHLAGEVLAAYRCPRWSNLHYFGSGDGLRGICPSALVVSIRLMIFII